MEHEAEWELPKVWELWITNEDGELVLWDWWPEQCKEDAIAAQYDWRSEGVATRLVLDYRLDN